MDDVALWMPIIISSIAAIVSVFALVRQWKRDKPDIAETYEQMATRQAIKIEELQANDEKQDCEIRELRSTIAEWEKGIRLLIDQITSGGEVPVWTPRLRR